MKSGKLMGISVMYNFRLDPDMDIEKIAIRRIPCACNGYLEQLNSVWKTGIVDKEQGSYKTSDRCEMKKIFDGVNDWQVVKLETSKNGDIYESDLAKEILHKIESRMSEIKMKGNYGATRTDDIDTYRYYIVEWDFNVYTAQDDIFMKGHNSSAYAYAYAGEMVYKAMFWNPVSKAKYEYIPMLEGEGDTTLKMKQVWIADINLKEISDYRRDAIRKKEKN